MSKRNRRLNADFSMAALTGKWLILAGVGVSLALLYVWQHVQLVRTGYAIRNFEQEVERWKKKNEALTLENEKLKNPQRIESVLARNNMGLVFPQGKNVVRLRYPRPQAVHDEEKSGSEGGTDALLSFMRGGGGAGPGKM